MGRSTLEIMIRPEAEAVSRRLTRVWVPDTYVLREESAGSFVYEAELQIDPYFKERVTLSVRMNGSAAAKDWLVELFIHPLFLTWHQGRDCYLDTNDLHNCWFAWADPEQTFINQWMPPFRRGCWLSGCPIEATAHEKAEWMQGFTPEEIEASNLRF